jgi:alpha-1,6-mannosyltransferase
MKQQELMAIKTLHLTNAFHPQSGGISTFYTAMLQMANQQQRPMRLVVPSSDDRIETVGSFGKIYFVRAPEAPLNRSYRCLYPTQYLLPDSRIRAILREERPDVIEICDKYNLHYLGGLIRAGMLGDVNFRPVILGLSCERMDENVTAYLGTSPFHRWFCRWYMRWVYFAFFDHHIAVSEHAAVELVAASRGQAVERAVWIRPMGVDAARFSPSRRSQAMRAELISRAGGRDDSALLLYAGRLAPEKNLSLLIEMMHILADDRQCDYRLLLVGDGIDRDRLQEQAAQLAPGHICFLEHLTDRDQLADVVASCDLFVHPNPREPFGIAPLEAMASGLPLVAVNSGGITSFANQNNAWLAEANATAFADAVREALRLDAARADRVQAALVTADEHNWDRTALGYFALYDAVHARFWGLTGSECAPPYTCSTPASFRANTLITVFSTIARLVFRAIGPIRRYDQRLPRTEAVEEG